VLEGVYAGEEANWDTASRSQLAARGLGRLTGRVTSGVHPRTNSCCVGWGYIDAIQIKHLKQPAVEGLL